MKCIVLFFIINLVVVLVLGVVMSVVFSVLGINSQSMGGLLVFVVIFGFGGLFILLVILKWMVKCLIGVVVIIEFCNVIECWLLDMVCCQFEKVGIGMLEVVIYDLLEINVFVIGVSKNNVLVVVSIGLL